MINKEYKRVSGWFNLLFAFLLSLSVFSIGVIFQILCDRYLFSFARRELNIHSVRLCNVALGNVFQLIFVYGAIDCYRRDLTDYRTTSEFLDLK